MTEDKRVDRVEFVLKMWTDVASKTERRVVAEHIVNQADIHPEWSIGRVMVTAYVNTLPDLAGDVNYVALSSRVRTAMKVFKVGETVRAFPFGEEPCDVEVLVEKDSYKGERKIVCRRADGVLEEFDDEQLIEETWP